MTATASNLDLNQATELSSLALGGLQAAESEFNRAASDIDRDSANARSGDTADLSSSATALLAAKENYAENLTAVDAVDEIAKQIIDFIV